VHISHVHCRPTSLPRHQSITAANPSNPAGNANLALCLFHRCSRVLFSKWQGSALSLDCAGWNVGCIEQIRCRHHRRQAMARGPKLKSPPSTEIACPEVSRGMRWTLGELASVFVACTCHTARAPRFFADEADGLRAPSTAPPRRRSFFMVSENSPARAYENSRVNPSALACWGTPVPSKRTVGRSRSKHATSAKRL
jgi:hypothetical protein